MSLRIVICVGVASFLLLATAQVQGVPLQPFAMDYRGATTSPADLSYLNARPAGRNGFVRIKDGHFVTPNGERIRFWGVNVTGQSPGSIELPPKAEAPMYARALARFGVNLVRLQFLDTAVPAGLMRSERGGRHSFDQNQLRRLDFLVWQLKKNGIYTDLNLNVERRYTAGDGVVDANRIGVAKGLTMYDKRLIELQKEYARDLLTHVNPYTGVAYRDEPAVAIVEITNENAIFQGYTPPTKFYAAELNRAYNDWLNERLSLAQLQRLRAEAGVKAGEPIPRLAANAGITPSRFRYETEVRFFIDLESSYYREMATYLRRLGVRQPLIGSADHWHFGTPYPNLVSLSKLDVLDGHDYWWGPGPQVDDPLHSTVVDLSRTAFAGKPFTVSETNEIFPNPYASEEIPIIAAYAGFQDWDMVILYSFEPKVSAHWAPYVGNPFDFSLDPVRMTEFAAGALMFRQFDIAPARKIVDRTYSMKQVLLSGLLPGAVQPPEGGGFNPASMALAPGAPNDRPYFTPGFPLQLPLEHGVRIESLEGPPTPQYSASDTDPIVSDTGQLSWHVTHPKAGIVTVESPRCEALIGFVKPNDTPLAHLRADITNNFVAIILTSMDGKPLSLSGKMLLNTGSRVANTGQVDLHAPLSRRALGVRGHSPTLIAPVTGVLTFTDLKGATAVYATALDGSGREIGRPTRAASRSTGWTLNLGTPVTPWYVVTVRH